MGIKLAKTDVEGFYAFPCRGCGYDHHLNTNKEAFGGINTWEFNGNLESPSANPSLLVNAHSNKRCHFFITNGKIQYLSDCWHSLAGHTIEMDDIV